MAYQRLTRAAELPRNRPQLFVIGEREIVVCPDGDGYRALDNICSHAYAQLHQGRLRRGRLICPLHGATFDVRTGAALSAPAETPLATYPVRVVDGMLEVDIDGGTVTP